MSLQSIAGVAYDRRNPDSPSAVAERKMREVAGAGRPDPTPQQNSAKQINSALEALKRYIPTEFLALYLPFMAIAKERFTGNEAELISLWMYLIFVAATPLAVWLIYKAKAAEAGKAAGITAFPLFEALLATISFAIWGASVPSMFPGNQWWLAMVAMASAFALPLIDTAFGKKNTS